MLRMKIKIIDLLNKISNKKRAIPIIFKENKYSSVREASRKTGICQWTIRKYGREVMPNE